MKTYRHNIINGRNALLAAAALGFTALALDSNDNTSKAPKAPAPAQHQKHIGALPKNVLVLPKHDPNTTPAGVPGENRGSSDEQLGQGPAGQTPNEQGFTPSELQIITPENPGGKDVLNGKLGDQTFRLGSVVEVVEMGVDRGANLPAVPSTSAGQTIPPAGGDFNPQ